jgi:hypothetical protein
MSSKELYSVLTDNEYAEKFGLNAKNKKKQSEAFKKAWENRNFEIDKFWTRSAYFWSFIVLIFGAYISITTGDHSSKPEIRYLVLYLILLGIIFSVAWLLVIKGSKRWQVNWEAHIEKLEDAITGPLYKIIYCTNQCFFSVSKINEILASVVIGIWILLLIQYFSRISNG